MSSTPAYPNWSFAALPHVPDALSSAVARSLLQAGAETGATWGAPISPAQVETLLEELGLHPLQRPLWEQAVALLWHYWHYTLLVALLILLGLLHHLWVQGVATRRSHELHAAHLRLRQREQELASARRLSALGEMATGLAHELNQPLAAIRHYAEGCSLRLEQQDPDHPLLPILARIDQEAARGAAVIQRARQWLRHQPAALTALPLRGLIEELVHLHEPQLQRQHVRAAVTVVPPGLRARGDRTALEQVLSNLIGNSIQAYQACGRGGVVRIDATRREGKVYVRVADDAGGFSAERLQKPFELFQTTREEGLGLGLVISQRLMQAQEGTLTLANSATGAEVTLSLPEERA